MCRRLITIKTCQALFICLAFLLSPRFVWARGQQVPLALTPPMGWNDWYRFGCKVNEAEVRAAAAEIVSSGMKAVGYEYVNVDDCWQGQRDKRGFIHSNSRFPDMKGLADYIHSKGLKFGLYSSPGPKTCDGYEGSYGHEEQDALTYARWGVDFVKYDWCSAGEVYSPSQMKMAYAKMHAAIVRSGRPMVFSLCQYGLQAVWTWGASVGGNLWRTTSDIGGNYDHWSLFGFQNDGLEMFAGPGHWNDPDILQIGLGRTNYNEDRSQMTLWCILAAPLLAGNDLTKMSGATLRILTNREIIAVDQDPKGIQGHRVWDEGPLEIWVRPLANRSKAVALFNRSTGSLPTTVRFRDLGMVGRVLVRDLWAGKELMTKPDRCTVVLPPHGADMLTLTAAK